MNLQGLKAIYFHEMDRMRELTFQSLVSPFISTSLYFVVLAQQLVLELQRLKKLVTVHLLCLE